MVKTLPKKLAAVFASPFFKGSFAYLSGSILNAVLPLLIMPVLTRYLTPADYGIAATSTVLVQIFVVVIGMNTFGLLARSYFDNQPEMLRNLVSTTLGISAGGGVVLTLLLIAAGGLIERWTQFPAAWLPAVVVISVATIVQNNYLAIVQSRREPVRYVLVQTLSSTLNLLIAVVLVVQFGMDWRGRMWAQTSAAVATCLFCLAGLAYRLGLLKPIFNREAARELLAFGLPLVPHILGGWIMTMSARLYLNNMATVADTGLYSVAFNLASPVALIVGAGNKAYIPTLFEMLSAQHQPLDKVRLCRILTLVILLLPVLALLFSLGIYLVLPLIVGPRFYRASGYVTWLALAFAVQGIYFIFGNFVIYSKKTRLMTWRADFLGGLVLVIGCPLLIRWNGPIGAAQATCAGFAASTLGCFTASQQALPMPWLEGVKSLFTFRSPQRS